jgi:hypothetical protein
MVSKRKGGGVMAFRRTKAVIVALAIGGIPLITMANCDPYTNAFDFFRDDDCGDYYYDSGYYCDDYYYGDYYYDDYYYDPYYDDYYYDDCWFCF